METTLFPGAAAETVCPGSPAGTPRVLLVPIEQLETHFAPQRRGGGGPPHDDRLGALPLRVTPWSANRLLVLDGHKRLARWRARGARHVPVLIEQAASRAQARALLLEANAPRRTVTAMDEARLVHALRVEDRYGPEAISKLLGKRPAWVASRELLSTRLAPAVSDRVDRGQVRVSLALALCSLAGAAQEPLLVAAEQHRLTGRETLALVAAFKAAEDSGRAT